MSLEDKFDEIRRQEEKKKSGGLVFAYGGNGITRRDLGAIEMAAALVPEFQLGGNGDEEGAARCISRLSYLVSDALIAEGKK